MSPPASGRARVMALALGLSIACHFALLMWLDRGEGVVATPRSLDVVLVASSPETRIAPPDASQPNPPESPSSRESPVPTHPAANRAPAPASEPVQPSLAASESSLPDPVAADPVQIADAAPADPVVDDPASARQVSAPPTRSPGARETVTAGLRLAIRQRLAEFLNYPPAARRRAIEGDPVVRFVIARDGSLLQSELAESSGSRHLDRAALRLVRDAAPYPGFPQGLDLAQMEIQIPIEYRLTRTPPS